MTTVRFPQVRVATVRAGVCPVCGAGTIRRRTFAQNISPYNRNADGTVRTRDEVHAAVRADAAAWVPDFTHEACAVLP